MPAQVISSDTLLEMLRDPDVPDKEIAPYLMEDRSRSRAFDPQLKIDPTKVIADPFEAAVAMAQFNSVARWRRAQRYRRRIADGWQGKKLVSEGDSWFQYPFLLEDVIDHLETPYAIYSLDGAGDLLSDMINQDEVVKAIKQELPDALLLSGGGNDLLGEGRLVTYLHHFSPDREPKDYLNDKFDPFLQGIVGLYERLLSAVFQANPQLPVICHGYDFAVPAAGRWLGRPMEELGIRDRAVQKAIVKTIVDKFNVALQTLSTRIGGKVQFLDLRGTVGSGQWYDELHPTDTGFKSVADRFAAAIEAI